MNILDAAYLMSHAYYDKSKLQADISISLQGMEAHFVGATGSLVIEGTNSLSDWFDYNFDVFTGKATTEGDGDGRAR